LLDLEPSLDQADAKLVSDRRFIVDDEDLRIHSHSGTPLDTLVASRPGKSHAPKSAGPTFRKC
jgi:hypothetical protein